MMKPPINADDILAELPPERRAKVLERGRQRIAEEKMLRKIDHDIAQSPDRIKPLSTTRIAEARELTKDVEVGDDEVFPDGGFCTSQTRWGRLPVAEVIMPRALLGFEAKKKCRLVMHLIIDDSAPGDGSHQFLVGLVASDSGWESLAEKWSAGLQALDLPFLHTSDFLSGTGDHRTWNKQSSETDRIAVIRRFGEIIPHHVMAGIIIGVDAWAFDQIFLQDKKKISCPMFAFDRLLSYAIDSMQKAGVDEPISLLVDDSSHAMKFYGLWRKAREIHSFARKYLCSITFADDKKIVPLQAADLVAAIVLREHQRRDAAWRANSPYKGILPLHPNGGYNVHSERWERDDIVKHAAMIREAAKAT
jgi:hypothetical protein